MIPIPATWVHEPSAIVSDSIHPRGQKLRDAVRWLSDNGDHSPQAINATAVRFDLSPADTEFLFRTFVGADDVDE